ncbi:unnamed protein product [Porites lobata]|uniref:Uncharacterized protein n=1 Tax=Porites lobata TaxID=104759 RepID=A0ABN8NQ92_9CNID|nr:unnamed protein product [Porites lobata]
MMPSEPSKLVLLTFELGCVGSRQQLSKVQLKSVTVGDSEIKPISSVHSLGAWSDKNLSMSIDVSKVCMPYRTQCKILLLVHRAILVVAPVIPKLKLLSFKESGSYN